MSGGHIEIDLSELQDFFARAGRAATGDFKRELELFLEGLGIEFLRVIQDEIKRRKVMDTRLLIDSFAKGAGGNVWKLEEGGLTLEVGSSVEYAKYVNDGHWTMDRYGECILRYNKDTKNGRHKAWDAKLFGGSIARFVPGYWRGHRFVYDPSAKTGMVLKQNWVPGKPYFDNALRILNRMYPDLLERKLQGWLDSYFGGAR